MSKKKSESGSMWEVMEREERRGRGRTGGEKVVGWCGLAVAQDVKHAAAKKVAAARFRHKRYCNRDQKCAQFEN